MSENIFERLNSINVSDKTEKKNGLTYLSWSWAWGEFKKKFPYSYYTIYEDKEGRNYFTDGRTCWVKTGVTLVDKSDDTKLELIEYLPVMDFKNRSIPLESVTSFDVNKAIQRSMTKACARHGLGLYIYSGEDLPEETEEVQAAKRAEKERISDIIKEIDKQIQVVTASMTVDQKKEFGQTVIIPAVGQMNYRVCKDVAKLETLLNSLKKSA